MVDLLKTRKKIAEDKIIFWPNWTNINAQITQLPLKGEFRKKHAINDNIKIIGYAGNIGKKQGLELLIDLADQFKKNNDVCFFIIGDGAGLQQLKEYNNNKKLSNTIFLPFLNNNEYNTFLVDANAVFIPQLKVPFDIYFPSKLLGIMVSKTPIIVSADPDSELYRTVYENHLGFVSIYGSLTSLINHLNEIISNSPFTNLCTENAYAFVQKYDREIVLRRTNNLY
jgi:colanic acid biosynthesis glycosyl transferase WcaI